jgi:hypothetical protein
MISGFRPDTPIVQRAGVARGDLTVWAKGWLQLGQTLFGRAVARAVVDRHRAAIGQRKWRDLTLEETILLVGNSALL